MRDRSNPSKAYEDNNVGAGVRRGRRARVVLLG